MASHGNTGREDSSGWLPVGSVELSYSERGYDEENTLWSESETVEHEITITGDIIECFALACPVAELLWIDDWKFDLVYSESGKNETGCVFLEPSTGLSMLRSPGANAYWYTTRYEVEQHRFDAIWLTRDLAIARWEVSMTDLGDGRTRVKWSLVYTGLGAEGNSIIGEPGLGVRMKKGLSFIATSLKHYVETGESPQRFRERNRKRAR